MKILFTHIISFLLLSLPIQMEAQHYEEVWLSGQPPQKALGKVKPNGMQHYYGYRNRGVVKLLLWPKCGSSFQKSSSFQLDSSINYKIIVKNSKRENLKFSNRNAAIGNPIEYDFKEEGFHNIFLKIESQANDTNYIHIAREERLNHSCRNGHKHVMVRMSRLSYPDIAPLELIRHRQPYENFHGILESEMKITFDVLFHGKPLEGCPVTISNQSGWVLNTISDEKGHISFQLPNDYFTNIKELDKHETHRFFIAAKHISDNHGKITQYSTKMEFDYIPSRSLYQSYVSGWSLLLFTIIAAGLVVYIIIRRKNKKHKYVY